MREGEAAELRKGHRVVRGIIGISSATWRIGHWKRVSWVRVNGIDRAAPNHSSAESRLRADPLAATICLDIWIALTSFDSMFDSWNVAASCRCLHRDDTQFEDTGIAGG